jgi:hypothetical protein
MHAYIHLVYFSHLKYKKKRKKIQKTQQQTQIS